MKSLRKHARGNSHVANHWQLSVILALAAGMMIAAMLSFNVGNTVGAAVVMNVDKIELNEQMYVCNEDLIIAISEGARSSHSAIDDAAVCTDFFPFLNECPTWQTYSATRALKEELSHQIAPVNDDVPLTVVLDNKNYMCSQELAEFVLAKAYTDGFSTAIRENIDGRYGLGTLEQVCEKRTHNWCAGFYPGLITEGYALTGAVSSEPREIDVFLAGNALRTMFTGAVQASVAMQQYQPAAGTTEYATMTSKDLKAVLRRTEGIRDLPRDAIIVISFYDGNGKLIPGSDFTVYGSGTIRKELNPKYDFRFKTGAYYIDMLKNSPDLCSALTQIREKNDYSIQLGRSAAKLVLKYRGMQKHKTCAGL